MPHPLQCLLTCGEKIVAACGSSLYLVSLNGELDGSWPAASANGASEGPPSKRLKLSREESGSSTEIVLEKVVDASRPPFVKLCRSRSGRYIVGVTGEDKCIRVFEVANGLDEISARCMPKRPCAIALTADDQTILCADKFGDVYALPLLGRPFEIAEDDAPEDELFKPSATALTVHTKRNLRVLEQQKTQKNQAKMKKAMTFEHNLVLGHISLLTDVACATSQGREYILTADRDEHIRVSRGLPQSHIIENYCLGHTQFLSRLCLIPSRPELLLAGGGDDFVLLWNWREGRILHRLSIKRFAFGDELIVSKIEPLHSTQADIAVVITLERSPLLLVFALTAENKLELRDSYDTGAKIVDLAIVDNTVIYSLDSSARVGAVKIDPTKLTVDDFTAYAQLLKELQSLSAEQRYKEPEHAAKGKSLQELLYPLESLRKRAGEDDDP